MKYLLIISGLLLTASVFAQQERRFIRKGTSDYKNEKYLESEIEYRKALEKNEKSYEAQFNLADALYKQKKLDKSLEQFQALAGTVTDPDKLAQIYHNIGNIYFAAGEYDKSIDAYKKSLRNNPLDNETRYNYIAAEKMKKKQEQNQQQQQQQEQKPEPQPQPEQPKEQDDKMSKEDAQRLLNAIQQDENELQKKTRKAKSTEKTKIEKNW